MTLVVDALARIAREVSVSAPSSWVSATADEHVEIRDDFLAATVADIADRVDLPFPVGGLTTITGTGVEDYALPADFLRLQRDPLAVYDISQMRGCIPLTTDGQWVDMSTLGAAGASRYYALSGYDGAYNISFIDAPTSDISIQYVSTAWMATSGGTAGSMLTSETDVLLMPRRVVEAGTVWRWRERKGLPFDAKYNEYEALLSRLSNDTRGRRIVNMGERKTVRWQDMIPAYIPAS